MSKLGIVLLVICILDLSGTVAGIHSGYFVGEVNPILDYFLFRWGLIGFITAKMILFVLFPILILEIAPKFNPIAKQRIKIYYKAVILIYLLVLGGSVIFQLIA